MIDPDNRTRFNELLEKGIYKCPGVVKLNTNLSKEDFHFIPFIVFLKSLLKLITDNNGSLPLWKKAGIDLNWEMYCQLIEKDLPLQFSRPINAFELHVVYILTIYVHVIAGEFGITTDTGKEISLTRSGWEIYSGRNIKDLYYKCLRFMTMSLNWFFFSDYPMCVEDIQDSSGFHLYLLSRLGGENRMIAADQLWDIANSIYPFNYALRKLMLPYDEILNIYEEYFIWNYCYLMGFINPLPEEGERFGTFDSIYFQTTPLFARLFEWHID